MFFIGRRCILKISSQVFVWMMSSPRLEITCKWNKNCTEKIMVPLKFLRKRSSRFGATCWGITTHQANRADGLCKYCKGLPHPSACASLWVVIPQHVAPNLELLFPNYFSGTYGISVQFFLIGPVFLTGWASRMLCAIQILNSFDEQVHVWIWITCNVIKLF